jgi:pilus assembly protein CpaF
MTRTRIISVCAPKGGAGASFVASNLALGMGLAAKTPTLLIDLDLLRGGAQASLYSLEREVGDHHLGRLAHGGPLTPSEMEPFFLQHPKVPVHLLAAPPVEPPTRLDGGRLYEILLMASLVYKNIVIDTSQPSLNELMGVCIDCSAQAFAVVIPDIISLQSTSQFLQQVERAQFSLNKFQLVLNMANLSTDLSAEEIGLYFQDLLKRPLEHQIPFEPIAVIKSINRGIPLLQRNKAEHLVNSYLGIVKAALKAQPLNLTEVHISLRSDLPLALPEIGSPSSSGKVLTQLPQPMMPGGVPGEIPQPTKALTKVSQAIAGWSPEQYRSTKQQLHKRMLQEMRLNELEFDNPDKRDHIKQQLRDKLSEIMTEDKIEIASRKDRAMLIEELIDEALGLGPLETLLRDESVTEIMVNGPNHIFIERKGKLELSHRTFLDEKQLRVVIDRIVAPLGRRIDESSPMVDARLADGSRVNIIIPPLALNGATLSIRKFPSERLKAQHLVDFGSVTQEMAEFLKGAVEARLNILICGGTGSGKTTLLNIMSSFIPPGARIVTIEDAAELQLHQDHVIRLESRPPNIEGKGQVSIRELVKNSLRMRPDRIVVGEVRGGEALDMLQAMNTGHEGSLTTCHANAPREALARLETMVLMAGVDLPVRAIREQIASAVDLIVHQSRLRDGTRKVTHIVEVNGMEGDIITTQEIFKFEQLSVDGNGHVIGRFKQADIRPSVLDKFVYNGIRVPKSFEAGYQALDTLEDALSDKPEKEKKGFFW